MLPFGQTREGMGLNELARLNLFEQVTRRPEKQAACHAESRAARGSDRHRVAIFGQVPAAGRPFPAIRLRTVGARLRIFVGAALQSSTDGLAVHAEQPGRAALVAVR
jgi:hypothetical protein